MRRGPRVRTFGRMARPLRIIPPNSTHHVTARGVRQLPVFFDDVDFAYYVELLGRAAVRFGWLVPSYCLIPNHVHLLVFTPLGNLSQGMQWLHGTYATVVQPSPRAHGPRLRRPLPQQARRGRGVSPQRPALHRDESSLGRPLRAPGAVALEQPPGDHGQDAGAGVARRADDARVLRRQARGRSPAVRAVRARGAAEAAVSQPSP